MKVEATVFEVKARELTALEYNGQIFRKDFEYKSIGNKSILEKWIVEKQIKGFNLEDFIKSFPQFKQSQYRHHLDSTISKLIERGLLIQGNGVRGNSFEFIVKEDKL